MPRQPRKISQFGYYHLIAKGNGKQIIFEENKDYIKFLWLLKQYSEETNVKICAYCLMDNHFHLLVYDRNQNFSNFMQKLVGTYAKWFNTKYQRKGHLFEERFTSVPIESEEKLCTIFRYILTNPEKAGICPASEYSWSSYRKYGAPTSFVDTHVLQTLLGSYDKYEEYIAAKYEYQPKSFVHDDEWAKSVICETLNIENPSDIKSYDWQRRNEMIRILKEKGLSIRQIERLTGISKSVIQRS